jgi:uncharacterized protein YbbC (DUF1343 family)
LLFSRPLKGLGAICNNPFIVSHSKGPLSMKTPTRWFLIVLGLALFARVEVAADPAASNVVRPPTATGIDVLVRDGFGPLEGRRVGLITNHTGLDRSGVGTIRRLHEAPGVELAVLFSPEHGLHGKLDVPEIADSEDAGTGIRVYSLYGKTRRPEPAMLDGIDTLVFDIQDIGTRFYTYISTLGLAMEAAAEQGIRFVVLDRPNPINGVDVSGPVADPGRESFTAFHRLPVRHGMTVGELALMFRAERKLDLELEIVELERWDRAAFYDATGQRWVNPSPNMRSLTQALLYPGIGLLETTNLSVGRGTDTPFEVLGAPWLDGQRLAAELRTMSLPGVAFVPVEFVPDASKFEGETCRGVNVIVIDRAVFDPVHTGLEIARQLRILHPDEWAAEAYDRLLVHAGTLEAVREGKMVTEMEAGYREGLEEFMARRKAFLLYD